MLKDDVGIATLAQDVPDGFAKRPAAGQPFLLAFHICPVRWYTPMAELPAVDVPYGTQLLAILAPLVVRDDRYGACSVHRCQLNRLTAQPA